MEEDEDMHMCLVCHRTINGLLNYVNHKKSECAGRKPAKVLQEAVYPSVTNVTDIRNQQYGLGSNTSYMHVSQSYSTNGQQVFSSGDSFQRQEASVHDTVHSLNPQTGISSGLDVFDSAQFQTTSADTELQDIGYSLQTSQNSSTNTLFDSQASISNQQTSCDLAAFGLSPGIFTSSRILSKITDTTVSHENHGLLNACISHCVEADFGSAVNIHIPSSFPIMSSDKSPNPNGAAININEIISDNHSKSQVTSKTASEKVDDFFQSLELMSKSNPKTEKGSSFSQPLLPLSNILNNLTFSSDEEDLGFNFADDVSLDSMSEDSDDNTAPPSDYTGAKWKPGERPGPSSYKKNRQTFRGKWPPGQVPAQTSAKYYGARPKGGKNISSLLASRPKPTKVQKPKPTPASSKSFSCNFCDLTFENRFKYSNHCGSVAHKERVFGKRDTFQTAYGRGGGKSFVFKEKDVTDEKEVIAGIEESPEPESIAFEATKEQLSDKEVQEKLIDKDVQDNVSDKDVQEKLSDNDVQEKLNDKDVQEKLSDKDDAEPEESLMPDKEEETVTREDDDEMTEGNQFYTAVPLQIHVCSVCDKKFPNKYFISNHLLTKYHRNRALAQKQTAFAMLERYHKYIVRLSPFQCAICRFYFNKASELESHLKSEAHKANCEDLVGELTCSLCMYKTHDHDDLLDHVTSQDHTSNTAKLKKLCVIKESHVKCKCKYCSLVFMSFTRLKRHIQLKHADKQPVAGVVKRQIGVRTRPECEECQQRFQSVSALQLHVRRHHTREKPYHCDTCDVRFSGKHSLLLHCKTLKHMQRQLDMESQPIKKGKHQKAAPHKKHDDNRTSTINPVDTSVESTHPAGEGLPKVIVKEFEDKKQISESMGAVNKAEVLEVKHDGGDDTKMRDKLDVVLVNEDDMLEETDVEEVEDDEMEWTPGKKTRETRAKRSGRRSRKLKELLPKVKQEKVKKRTRRKKGEMPVKIHKCDHCDFVADSYNGLRPHYLKEHSTQIKICELCDMIYLSDKAYKLHVLSKDHQQNINRSGTSETEKFHACHVCKKKFTDEKYCKFHTAYQHFHLTSEEAVMTEYNGKDVTREKYETFLNEINDLEPTASVECPECKKSLKKGNFIEHLRTHSGDRPFKCKICPKAFISSVTLRRHLLGHFGCQERTCEVCGKHFKKTPSFDEHMKLHLAQSGDVGKVHTCEICGQAFYFEHQLHSHARRHRKREFACTFPGCHWKFVFATELKYHMHSHTQNKPFLCDICGYATVTKCRLKRHERTHTGERNYHCEYCTYKAGNSTHLHRHMRIHIGSKPFKCPYCQYACNTHENMRKHIILTKKHEGLSIYPCKFCKYGTNSCKEFRNHLVETHEDEIGPNFHLVALSTFTGLFDKALDPKEPEEGNRIFQARERLPRDPKKKKSRKSKTANKEEKVGDAMDDKSKEQEMTDIVNDLRDQKHSGVDAKDKVKKSVKNESHQFQWPVMPEQEMSSCKIVSTETKTQGTVFGDDLLLRTRVSDISSSYFVSTADQMRMHNLEAPQNLSTNQLVPLSQYKPAPEAHQLKPEYMPAYAGASGLNLSHMTFHQDRPAGMKMRDNQSYRPGGIESDDRKPANMMYHNYCTKFNPTGESDGTGNLVIDMNFGNT